MIESARGLDGRVGIVTGAGKGLGRAFALDLAGHGASLIVNNRNRLVDDDGRGSADHVVDEIRAVGGSAIAEYSDVTDVGSAERMIALALATYGRLDFVVANAAIIGAAMFHKTNRVDFGEVLEANVVAAMDLVQRAFTELRAQGHGHIVLVASTAGLHGEVGASAYAASKGALMALGRTIAAEGASRGVRTNMVLPYATTPMTDAHMHPTYHDSMSPSDVAPVVRTLVDPASTLNGQVIITANGAVRAASSVEWGTVALPDADALTPVTLRALLETSRLGAAHEYRTAQEGFLEFAKESVDTASSRMAK